MMSRAFFIMKKEVPQMMAVANSMGFASSFMVLGDIRSTPNCKV